MNDQRVRLVQTVYTMTDSSSPGKTSGRFMCVVMSHLVVAAETAESSEMNTRAMQRATDATAEPAGAEQ
jgi:hypothetical protein